MRSSAGRLTAFRSMETKNPDGTMISEGDLGLCNVQIDGTFGYRYHTSPNAPYIVQCLVGVELL